MRQGFVIAFCNYLLFFLIKPIVVMNATHITTIATQRTTIRMFLLIPPSSGRTVASVVVCGASVVTVSFAEVDVVVTVVTAGAVVVTAGAVVVVVVTDGTVVVTTGVVSVVTVVVVVVDSFSPF